MKLRWFNLMAVLSLLLCLAASASCWRSYYRMSILTYRHPTNLLQLGSANGQVGFTWVSNPDGVAGTGEGFEFVESEFPETLYYWPGESFAGFGFVQGALPEGFDRAILMPHGIWVLLFSILPASWIVRRIRRRPDLGLCPTCGYDLRASKIRCPECGTTMTPGIRT